MGVASAVDVLDVLRFHVAPLVLPLPVPLPPFLLGPLSCLLLLFKVFSCLQAGDWPPALHLFGTKDGESRAGPIPRQRNGTLGG